MSCHSCHTDGHTSNRLADTLGDGVYGNAKRVPSLLGTATSGPWAWTGTQESLPGQIRKSLTSTMHSDQVTKSVIHDLTAYLKTLKPPESLRAARVMKSETAHGQKLFESHGCAECHAAKHMTREGAFDVGLEDKVGLRKFNPPSLIGVSQRDRLLHDGRVSTLKDVLQIHPPGATLNEVERLNLAQFLLGL